VARFEKAIEDEEARFRYARQKMQEATDNSDGEAFTKAQELWYDSRRKLENDQSHWQPPRAAEVMKGEHPRALPVRPENTQGQDPRFPKKRLRIPKRGSQIPDQDQPQPNAKSGQRTHVDTGQTLDQ
jgi:hypothetical protein